MNMHNAKPNTTVTVYISTFDSDVVVGDVFPAMRNEVIQRCTDTLAKQQRFCVWKLLDFALRDFYGMGVDGFEFTISDSGKWSCNNGVYFSLAHCNNVVAVALCNSAVGVDIEAVEHFSRHVNDDSFAKRVLNDAEQGMLSGTTVDARAEALARIWTQKESIFKLRDGCAFIPKSVDTTKNSPLCQILTINGTQYAISVAVEGNSEVKTKLISFDW